MTDYTMREPLLSDVTARLITELEMIRQGDTLRKGVCPSCGKPECFTDAQGPWTIKCGRLNNCGATWHVKELFPDLFNSWSERYGRPTLTPQGTTVPPPRNAVADAYLEIGRGFDLAKIRGWYSQEHYFDETLGIGSATVRFPLESGGHWERLIDKPERFGKRKAAVSFGARFAGEWWIPPASDDNPDPLLTLAKSDELWITEGIFDAIALMHAGITAAACISCSNYPSAALGRLVQTCVTHGLQIPRLIVAFDDDQAGTRYTRKFREQADADGFYCFAAVVPAQPGQKRRDWNDAWQRGELEPKDLDGYRYAGSLLLAKTPEQKARLMFSRTGYTTFWFEHGSKLCWFNLDMSKFDKAMEALEDEYTSREEARDKALEQSQAVTEIANCYPEPLYYLANRATDEAWYFYRVRFPFETSEVKNTFSGQQLSSPGEFKKRLLHVAQGGLFTGNAHQLDTWLKSTIGRIKIVETIDYVGYSRDHGAWLLGDICVRKGRIYHQNDEEFFDFGRVRLKTLAQSPAISINPNQNQYTTGWIHLLHTAYGARGIVTLAFWFGSLFAEQIRIANKSFPFLEVVGEAGSGKSTLIEFLWKLVGRVDYEGFDPVKSTMAARARNFAQVSNLPVVLIESDREEDQHYKQRGFDWDEMKPLYNGRSVRARGMRNGGNDTYEPPFKGSIVISQNAPVASSEAIMQRICHIEFNRSGHTQETKRAAEELERINADDVSGFTLTAVEAEKPLLQQYGELFASWQTVLESDPAIKTFRLAKNHAQLAALVELLADAGIKLIPQSMADEATTELIRMARDRQRDLSGDHPVVEDFWSCFDYLQDISESSKLNHVREDGEIIAVNLKHFESVAANFKLSIPDTLSLKRHLKGSKSRPFVEANRPVYSLLWQRTTRCWIFAKPKGQGQ